MAVVSILVTSMYSPVIADVRGVAYLEDVIIMLDIFLFLW
jgi:hypothetical protein